MLTQINMNALNDVPQFEAKGRELNPHMFVGEYNVFEDPVINEFVNEWKEFFKVLVYTVVLYITYGAGLCLLGWSVTALWPLINEWIEIIFMVSSTAVTAMFLKWIHDETEEADAYIVKLKADLAAKNAIIAELELKLASVSDSDSEIDSLESETESLESDDNSDSDYDPDLDEY